MEGFPDQMQQVVVTAGGSATLDFTMRLAGLKEEVTVTATGSEQSVFESFQSVNTVDALSLAQEAHTSIGEVLDKEPGIAKRGFGPGPARPVVRGFDGDRVGVTQDGVATGSLGSQSGDHAEPIDVLSLERIEVVKGPATLLYGSSATGGEELGSDVSIQARRHDFKFGGGWRDLRGFGNGFKLTLDYSDYADDELEGEEVGTHFANKNLMYRGVFDQNKRGRFTGSWGFSGFHRDFSSTGAETLAPPTTQDNFAVFGLESIDFERVKFQLGGRVEHNASRRCARGWGSTGGIRRST